MSTAAPQQMKRPFYGWLLHDGFVVTQRNLIATTRVPEVLFFSLVQPVIFVLLFAYVFGGAIPIPGADAAAGAAAYREYLMPGIFVQTVTFGAINTAIGLADDKGSGLLERLRSLPMSRSAVLGGRVMADTTRNVFIVLLMVAVGMLVGFRPGNSWLMVAVGILLMISFGFALAWLFALIGLSVTNGEAAQAAAFPMLAPLTFASNLFVDPKTIYGPTYREASDKFPDATKAQGELGWQPRFDIEQTIRDACTEYLPEHGPSANAPLIR